MTFVLVAANADQIIQVSDRRLTTAGTDGPNVVTESAGKSGQVLCDDASALYSFTGLAKSGKFTTSTWMMEALQNAGKRNGHWREMIEHVAEIATEKFSTDSDITILPAKQRRLTMLITGYTISDLIFCAHISNFQDFINFIDHPAALDKFTVHCESSAIPIIDNPTLIQAAGAFSALTEQDERELRDMLERKLPARAIQNKASAIVHKISDRIRAGGTVGKRQNIARIEYKFPLVAVSSYRSDVVENSLAPINMVDVRSGISMGEITLSSENPTIFPKVGKNAPCPCQSGKKFRFCHRPKRWK